VGATHAPRIRSVVARPGTESVRLGARDGACTLRSAKEPSQGGSTVFAVLVAISFSHLLDDLIRPLPLAMDRDFMARVCALSPTGAGRLLAKLAHEVLHGMAWHRLS
jgi:hypothetical protein